MSTHRSACDGVTVKVLLWGTGKMPPVGQDITRPQQKSLAIRRIIPRANANMLRGATLTQQKSRLKGEPLALMAIGKIVCQ